LLSIFNQVKKSLSNKKIIKNTKKNKQLILIINDIEVTITWKSVKNLRIKVYPPNGQVKVSSPKGVSQYTIKNFVVSQLDWIKKHQLIYSNQKREPEKEYKTGEIHYLFGKPLILKVINTTSCQKADFIGNELVLSIKQNSTSTIAKCEKVLYKAYRVEIKKLIPLLIQQWEPIIGQKVESWNIRKMKARWGSCNISDRHILLNLELAKKTPQCIEYVVVHEMVHLIERYHNKRFYHLMDQFLPNWKDIRNQLNQ
jgi:predicted metal-dependent hydrolase